MVSDSERRYTEMGSVTGRIKEIKQPRGGYVKPSQFRTIEIMNNTMLYEKENIHPTIVGMVVDYMTRFCSNKRKDEAFAISLKGARLAGKVKEALELFDNIHDLDEVSIVNACKLVTFDVWYRNPMAATMSASYETINPDQNTIHNIYIMVCRSLNIMQIYGPVLKDGFTFEPEGGYMENMSVYSEMLSGKCSYGGYTKTVNTGDGDFLTTDTLWDFKVSKAKPTSKHTLQLLMYWIMGQHSGREEFRNITKLGIYNPRLDEVYLLDIKEIPKEVIKEIEENVICY